MRRIEIVGHRGAAAQAPENTLASFQKAIDLLADRIELDCHLTKDGIPIVVHDETVDRTTDGKGLVREKTLRELKRLDAGSWFHERFKRERLPTLEEVLEEFRSKVLFNIELKVRGSEEPILSLLAQENLKESVLLSSFDLQILDTLTQLKAPYPLQYILALPTPLSSIPLPAALRRRHGSFLDGINPLASITEKKLVEEAHAQKLTVTPWTVDHPKELEALFLLGVDGIITNAPDIARQVLSRLESSSAQ